MESNLPYINMEELFLDVKPLNALSPVSDQIAQTLCLVVYPVSSMTLQQRVNMLYSNKKL
jgi:hypothetical protein